MEDPRAARLVQTVLRCYPARWRRRHGEEAAELAALLIGDGTPAFAIAGSYLAGAAREWLTPRLTAVACALLLAACSVAVSAGLLASAAPARAAQAHGTSASQVRGRGPCRPGSPGPVAGVTPAPGVTLPTGVTPAMSRSQLIIWAIGHGRSC